ncbi:MAG TPA: hypothetical protein PLZ36_13655 [Armatimonadota bacterium]|nr:hypothetical protein [Armatimonadota bacterium]HOS44629.1 hypothetical protein [Armatimonadota bacterium]
MATADQNLDAMQRLAEIEDATAQLYRRYAGCFPEHQPFWEGLAREEDAHTRWVRALVANLQAGVITFRDNRFAPDTFRTFLDYLHARMREADAYPLSLPAALAIGIDIEESFVERGFFDVFDSDDARARTTLQRLSAESANHLGRLRAYQQEQRLAGA